MHVCGSHFWTREFSNIGNLLVVLECAVCVSLKQPGFVRPEPGVFATFIHHMHAGSRIHSCSYLYARFISVTHMFGIWCKHTDSGRHTGNACRCLAFASHSAIDCISIHMTAELSFQQTGPGNQCIIRDQVVYRPLSDSCIACLA